MQSFRITLGALLTLLVFVYVLDIALDRLRVQGAVAFNGYALQREVFGSAVLLTLLSLVALALKRGGLVLAWMVIIIAASPLISVVQALLMAMFHAGRSWIPQSMQFAWLSWFALLFWTVAVIARALWLTLAPRPHGAVALAGALVIVGVGYLIESRHSDEQWWVAAYDEPTVGDRFNVVSEQALVKQPELLAQALQAIEPQRAGVVDLYFVGFAAYASQDVFRKDVDAALSVVHERYDAKERSIGLVNNPATVLDRPLATASNLRAALNTIGRRLDADEDVVMLFLTSHGGADHKLAVEFTPLKLDQVDGPLLRKMIDEAGIRFAIVVVSACYSGGFIPALASDTTLVLTAAAADRTSFGCSHDSEMTFFTDALFNQALRTESSIVRAFEQAKDLVARRERAERLSPPSDPVMSIGTAMREKLEALDVRAAHAVSRCPDGGCPR
ncbi:MAG TPA: C13 family peptidase [Casimicrobiaceae bacterium]|nr:C13 family peptidase [Casimicrobiaceae bacterium]